MERETAEIAAQYLMTTPVQSVHASFQEMFPSATCDSRLATSHLWWTAEVAMCEQVGVDLLSAVLLLCLFGAIMISL
jgi:hypothetical protein